ncbi:MAG: tRNA pseudouridine(13) synthase TruD [Thermaceae bacterium]|nr:tRNA pseudouridine(13) synthase TruD [Thermaceae bacterium]
MAALLQFDFNRYPYLTPELPSIAGFIRQYPHDFQVVEVAAYLPTGQGEHLYLWLEKEELTTRAVFELLRDELGVAEKDIGVAGLKDKHALTRQWFSIPAKYQPRLSLLEGHSQLRLLETGLHTNKLRVGHLKGNRFRILVREAGGAKEKASDGPSPPAFTVCSILSTLQAKGVPNYYGPQRFGLGGQNPVRGYELVTQGKKRGDPWLGRFLIGSLQSLMFNDWLALRLERDLFDRVLPGDVAKKHHTGGEFVVEDAELENPRAQRLEISATGALYGKKYREAQGEARGLEDQILARYDLRREQFAARRGDRRLIRFPLSEWSVEEAEEGLWVSFFLPKGAYATTVLRELMKRNPEEPEEIEAEE